MFYVEKDENQTYEEFTIDDHTFYRLIKKLDISIPQCTDEDIPHDIINDLSAIDLKTSNDSSVPILKSLSACASLKRKSLPLVRKKRYSDQFKDPLFNIKDQYRKLKMMENFNNKNEDLEKVTEKYKEVVTACLECLKKEFDFKIGEIFKIFELKKRGFVLEDFDSYEEENLEINE